MICVEGGEGMSMRDDKGIYGMSGHYRLWGEWE